MNSKFLTLFAAAFIVAVIMVYQATKESAAQVLVVSDLLKSSENMTRIRVGGRVSTLSLDYVTEPVMKLSFRIQDPGKELPEVTESNTVSVVYEGLRPDMFSAGRDVIIDGRYENGVLYASNLLTQCPSKYEPPDPLKQNQLFF